MIRLANLNDIERIYDLGSYLHKNFRDVNDLEKMLNKSYFKIYVSIEDNEIIGFLSITELYESIDIVDLFVLENYRGKHIASGLINYMIGGVSESVSLITLEVAVDNYEAIHLYEKFGFEIVTKRLFYYGDTDAYLMGRKCVRE